MRGIDVSEWQGIINWDKVKAAGIEFAIIRIAYGQKKVDDKAIRNIEECIRVGIPFGVYNYSYALNVENAINEANLVIKTLAPYKDKISFPVIIDMEDADGYKAKHGNPSNETLVDICEKECLMYEQAGYYAMIYSAKSWWDTKLKSSKLDRFDKWMAWWNSSAENKFSHETYGIWQYADNGSVSGISGKVDMNISFKDYPTIIRGIKPQEPVKKSNEEIAQEVINGLWGNGEDRKNRLQNAGYDYNAIQNIINDRLQASKYVLGLYVVNTPSGLNVRAGAGTNYKVVKVYPNGTRFDTYQIKGDWAKTPSGWVNLTYCKLVRKY